jgi:hypothetical protein
MVTEREMFESTDVTPLDFCLGGLDEERSLQNKGGHTDELLASILDAAVCTKKREDQLRRTTRDLRTRVAKCIEVDGGILDRLL